MLSSRIATPALVAGVLFALVLSPATAPPPAGADAVFVSQQVKDDIANTGRARVIVEVQLPGAFVAEGELPTWTQVAAQRASLAFVQSRVLSRLQGRGHTVLHQFETVPHVVLEVEADALRELEASTSYVRRVVEDAIYQPLLAQSVPLVEGDQVWAQGFDGTGRVIAVLDTGVDKTHPFLAGKVVEEACYSSTSGAQTSSFCPNGQSAQTGPGSGVNCPVSVPVCWHGTHVAGIAAGNGAGAGVSFSGVAKGAQVMAVQIFSRGLIPSVCGGAAPPCLVFFASDMIKGLERVFTLRGQYAFAAVNLSVGGGLKFSNCDDDPAKPAIDNLRSVGIATVIAAGNNSFVSSMAAPACVSTAVSVGSTGKDDVVSPFSNVAAFLSLFAPGGDILSSYPGGQWFTISGTSMATPHVTGAFALLKQAAPGASVSAILTALQQTGVPITDTRPGGNATRPRIRIAHALAALAPGPPPPPPNALLGVSGDIPVPADYDGDHKADVAIYRKATGEWFIFGSATGFRTLTFGAPAVSGLGDTPVPSDYDGDGKADVAIRRTSNGTWFLSRSTLGLLQQVWGTAADLAVPADFDGDGKRNIAVWRSSDGGWLIFP